ARYPSGVMITVSASRLSTISFAFDGYLARNIAKTTNKRIVWWEGACMVHERFTAEEIRAYREANEGVKVIAHPECPPEVLDESDFWGSTSGMINWVRKNRPEKVVMVTECSMSDNIATELPDVEFVRPCNLCPHMKRITLENILWCLHSGEEEVTVDPEIIEPARLAVERMIEVSQRKLGEVSGD
ncbi:MAG: quinolinate synthase NadA, partial [Pseudomonadota bacterium]